MDRDSLPWPPHREDRAVNPFGMGSVEAGVPGQLQSITHGWENGDLLSLKLASGANMSHFCAARRGDLVLAQGCSLGTPEGDLL